MDSKIDSKTRIKEYISQNFPNWEKVDYTEYEENVGFDTNLSELYKIDNEEVVLISYTNISITGTERPKPQFRVFLDGYNRPFYFAKKHQLRYYLFSIFTKDDVYARGLDKFNPKDYIISIETNLDIEGSRRDLRSIYEYANDHLNGRHYLKCTRANYNADINQASFIYVGPADNPETSTFENFINIFDSRPYLNSVNDNCAIISSPVTPEEYSVEYAPFITALRTKPFLLLAGISGTGKSQKVKELAYMTCPNDNGLQDDYNTPGNYCIIEVKPNWHDSTELLGYYSNLSGKYAITPFLKFVHKAIQNEDVPFFVCLDEMNLAPVEQYFAEYLSVLETRAIKDGKIESAELLKKDLFEGVSLEKDYALEEKKVIEYLKENGLRLPENLFVVGTVNMDDTTHQFSRKVIDRAFTIEMNGDELKAMFEADNDNALKYYDKPLPLSELKPKYVRASDALNDPAILPYKDRIIERVPEVLGAFNGILKNTPFRVSYRVQNELVLYLSTLIIKSGSAVDIEKLINEASLVILLEKILPRVQGDEKLLNTSEGNVFALLKKVITEKLTVENDSQLMKEVCAKLDEMDNRLNNTYFANFF